MNIGVVALSAIFGIIFFKESTKIRKLIGLFAVVVAILCLTL
jgi:multidrug transporter EmrE-like cation transporter